MRCPSNWCAAPGVQCGERVAGGRNLFFIYNASPFDPDLVLSTGNDNQGIDVYGMPTVRSVGFDIKLEF